ncbi:hypothetical protein J8M21_25470 [Pseudoalteromonas luteoviolacea]|uniref:hypothetical protein n=1 Tax=Pseudoalteromonas luteoviolacea TaxID=43657 RepID=UPI001B3A3775|nr:hypothetical protein [Pseudoalteromonas luteoviolacea]MBQ4880552.1 hypothetical protein [Pseudoalteromonas luteoviolacea]MBQ4909602.1 hypothetical protein [Pseudoalteromonas luteoviolacea]
MSNMTRDCILENLSKNIPPAQVKQLKMIWCSILWDALDIDVNDTDKTAQLYKRFPLNLQKHVFDIHDVSGAQRRLPRSNEIPPIERQYSIVSFAFLVILSKEFIDQAYIRYFEDIEPALIQSYYALCSVYPFHLFSYGIWKYLGKHIYRKEELAPEVLALFPSKLALSPDVAALLSVSFNIMVNRAREIGIINSTMKESGLFIDFIRRNTEKIHQIEIEMTLFDRSNRGNSPELKIVTEHLNKFRTPSHRITL